MMWHNECYSGGDGCSGPRILLYGEGWDMGTGLATEDKAKKDNAAQ